MFTIDYITTSVSYNVSRAHAMLCSAGPAIVAVALNDGRGMSRSRVLLQIPWQAGAIGYRHGGVSPLVDCSSGPC